MEQRAAEILLEEIPDLYVTLSSEIGRIGLLERENAAILNALPARARDGGRQLVPLGARRPRHRRRVLHQPERRNADDGSEFAEQYPVLTFASGPTNSMRGAAFLSGVRDAVVVDVGGTTSDVGVLRQRLSARGVDRGRDRRGADELPDAGHHLVRPRRRQHRPPGRRPDDRAGLGRLRADEQRALVFGGDTLTTTDIAVAAGLAEVGDRVARRRASTARSSTSALAEIQRLVERAVDRIKTSADPVPVVLVGGGTILVGDTLVGASELIKPEHASVANAMGAAIAQVGGEIDRVFSLDGSTRDAVLEEARADATARAVAAGAEPEFGDDRRGRRDPAHVHAGQRGPHAREGGRRPRPRGAGGSGLALG